MLRALLAGTCYRCPALALACLVIVGGATLVPTGTATGAECKIMDFAPDLGPSLARQRVNGMPSMRTITLPSPSSRNAVAGAPPGAKRDPDVAPRDEADSIRRTIERRDVDAFVRAIPTDPERRQIALRKSLALDHAFRNAALAIVRQILRWQPDALGERSANSKKIAVEAVANEWSTLAYFAQQSIPVENPPAEDDYVELLRILLQAGADPDGQLDWRPPLGIVAALPPTPATLAAAKLLIAAGAKVNAPRSGAQAPLVFAAETQNGEIARLMLQTHQATRESLDAALVKTPIIGANPVLAMLLEAGADINTRQPSNGDPRSLLTPAQSAASRFKFAGERDLMQLMIRYKADPNRVVHPGVTDSPLMLVTPDPELMAGLLALGADSNYRNLSGDTALLLAVRTPATGASPPEQGARYQAIALLLDHGADASGENKEGVAPLKETGPEDGAIVSLLMSHGGTWRMTESDLRFYRQYEVPVGRYSWAVLHEKDTLAAAMLSAGERLTADDCGLLYYAAATGSASTLSLLLERKLGSYAVRDDGAHTPLMAAAIHGQLSTVRLLLDHHVASVEERTPRSVGLVGGHGPPAPALLGGASPLMLAAYADQTVIVEELIRRGAEVNARDFGGHTALSYAYLGHGQNAVAVLKKYGARTTD